jgi:hypothetical protein
LYATGTGVRVQVRVTPEPASAKPGLHWQVDAPAWLVLPTGHAVHTVAPATE